MTTLRDWRDAGMRGIDVLEAWHMLQGSVGLLDAVGIPYRRLSDAHLHPDERFAAYVRRLPSNTTRGIIALENLWNSQLRGAPAVIPATYRPRVPADQCGAFY